VKDRAGNNAIEYMFFPLAAPGAGGMSSDALVEADGGGNNRVQCDRRREAVLVWMSGLDAPVETDTAGSGSCFLKLNNAPEPLWATRAAGGTATEYIFSLAVPGRDDMSSEAMLGTDLTSDNATEHSFFAGKRVARREASGVVFYYFADHLGSARIVTDAADTILDDSDYYPLGRAHVVTNATGAILDESDTTHLAASVQLPRAQDHRQGPLKVCAIRSAANASLLRAAAMPTNSLPENATPNPPSTASGKVFRWKDGPAYERCPALEP
jgi:hypothetical protein